MSPEIAINKILDVLDEYTILNISTLEKEEIARKIYNALDEDFTTEVNYA